MAKITASKKAKEARKNRSVNVVLDQKAEKVVSVKKAEDVKKESAKKEKAESKKATKEKQTEEKVAKKTAKLPTIQVIYQFSGCEVTEKELVARVKALWTEKGNKIKDIDSLNIYMKPEEKAAYYVINDVEKGKIDL